MEVLELGLTLERLLHGLGVPCGEQDAPVRRLEGVVFPLRQVVVVVHPLVQLLTQVDLDVAAEPTVDRLHLVCLVRWKFVVGWWQGIIRRPSYDKNKMVKVNGEKLAANFIIAYQDGEGPHCLTLGKYGKGPLREGERWVLLEDDK